MPIGSSRCTDVFHWVGLLIIAVCSLRADTQPIQDLVVPVGFNIGLYTNITAARYLTVSRSTRPPTTLSYIGSSNEAVSLNASCNTNINFQCCMLYVPPCRHSSNG